MLPDDPDFEIFDAAAAGDIKTVAAILKRRPELVKAQLPGLMQPLHLAAMNGQVEMITYLLSLGAPVEPRDHLGKTPLHYAAKAPCPQAVECLIATGADPFARDNHGGSALYCAMWALHDPTGRRAVVDVLVKHGLQVDAYCSLMLGDLEGTRHLLKGPLELPSGAPPVALLRAVFLAAIPYANGHAKATEQSYAVCRELADIIRAMVAKGASLEEFGDLLWGAVKLNNTIILELLLGLAEERSLLSDQLKQELAAKLFNACNYSVEHQAMADLLKRYGFPAAP